ncbi:Formin-like protein 20 [Sesamum angolense]|uniref:Formin-like protein 20 n=1 Tax=Sesamum angolense TaxID=2727404 RepID=A0AAE2BSA2_9LAMI|nr:Formin-like protein 20 [Sesamum angolense]
MNGIVAQLQGHYPDAAFMVFNFKEGERRSQLSDVLSQYDMTVMDYPRQYEGCPLLPLEMIHHFLRSSESWLSLEGQQNVLLMHCERGWPVLAFMLAGLLLYRKQYTGEQKTLEMVYKQAPRELLHLLSPLNPQPSQLRYLQYISRRNFGSDWPPSDTPLALDCIVLRLLPLYEGGRGCRPVVRVYGQDPSSKTSSRSSKLLFSSSKVKKNIRLYRQEECELVNINIHCHVQGDIVLECIHLEDDLVREEMIFRVMIHTAFIRSNVLELTRDEVDVLFSDADSVQSAITTEEVVSEDGNEAESISPEEFFEAEEIFSSAVDGQDGKIEGDNHTVQSSSQDNETHHGVAFRDDLDHHAFEDCTSDEGINGHEQKVQRNNNMLQNGDARLGSRFLIPDGASNGDTKSESAGMHDKSGEGEYKHSEDVPPLTKNIEKQGPQQKSTADNNKQKLDKGLSTASKKQSVSSLKSTSDAVGANRKSKQQEAPGAQGRQAKPNAVSSAPAALALGKDSLPGGKSKPQSVTSSSETATTAERTSASGRPKYSSYPSSLDLPPAQEVSPPSLPLTPLVESEPQEPSPVPLPPSAFLHQILHLLLRHLLLLLLDL